MYHFTMEWLNYHHLLYFWTVARTGSIARACEELRLAQPTISGQIGALEEALGEKLFIRQGRGLVLTEAGQTAYRYADEIFALGGELKDALKGMPRKRPLQLSVGVSDIIPKLITCRILEPALSMRGGVKIECVEGSPEGLLPKLAAHELDLVLAEAPATSALRGRLFNHLLGSSGLALFATAPLARFYRRGFPKSLTGAPFLLPMRKAVLRQALEDWFEAESITPRVLGEFQDTALITAFAQSGAGIFAAPVAIEREIRKRYQIVKLGNLSEHTVRYYAISGERKIKHPAVTVIAEAAQTRLFGDVSA